MRRDAVRHSTLVARGTQEVMMWIVQSFHTHTHFESENRLDFRSIREIDRIEVCHSDME